MMKRIARYLPPGQWWLAAWLVSLATLMIDLWLYLADPHHDNAVLPVVFDVGTGSLSLVFGALDPLRVAAGALLLLLLLCWRAPAVARRICLIVARLTCLFIASNMIALLWVYR